MANKKKQKTYQTIIERTPEIDWKSINLLKIIQFYLIETPAYKNDQDNLVSKRGKAFKSYGWEGGNTFKKLLKKMINVSNNLSCFEKVPAAPIKSKIAETFPPTEYCLFVATDYKTNHLLKAIRNSLAHGNFYQITHNKEKIYILQNYYNGLKAEIVLFEQTLLKWIDVIKAGPFAKEK